ncbi:MAG: hypothetical protein ACRDR6_08710 [Pseudonocardiaceae bacterium]
MSCDFPSVTRADRGPRVRRRRRARPSWWKSLLQRSVTETITVWQVARCLEREAAWVEKEKCQRALVLRLRGQLPIERVAVPIIRSTVSYSAHSANKFRTPASQRKVWC